MWTEIWNAVSFHLRISILNLLSLLFFFRLLSLFAYRRNSWFWGGVYIFFRVAILQFLVNGVLYYLYRDARWINVLVLALAVVNIFVSYACAYHIFAGSLLKVAIACWCAEIIASSMVMVTLIIVNLIEGRPSLPDAYAPFLPWDFLVIPLMLLLYALFERCFGGWLRKIRDYEPRHRKLLWLLLSVYIFLTLFTFNWNSGILYRNSWLYSLTIPFGMFVFWAAGMGILYGHRRSVNSEYEYLRLQQRLAESSYYELNRQIAAIQSYQKIVDAQMEEIAECGGSPAQSRRYENYVRELNDAFHTVRGTYCEDWTVDAMLCQEEKRCRGEGILADFQFQGYDRGGLEPWKMLLLLGRLLDLAHRNMNAGEGERRLCMSAAAYRNQLAIRLAYSAQSGRKPSLRNIRREVKSCHGSVQSRRERGMCEVLLILQREDAEGNFQ